MRWFAEPGSIRRKLVILFLIAVTPMLVVQVWNRAGVYVASRRVCERYQTDMARAISISISTHLDRLKRQHANWACTLARGNMQRESVELLCGEIDCSVGWEANTSVVRCSDAVVRLEPGTAGATSVSDIHLKDSRPFYTIHTPVKLSDGENVVLTTDISCASIVDRVPRAGSAFGWHGCSIEGERGKLVFSENEPAKLIYRDTSSRNPGSDTDSDVVCPSCGVDCIATIQDIPEAPWSVVVTQRTEDAFAFARLEKPWLMAAIYAALFGIFASFVFGNRLARPIKRLALAASDLAVGDYRKRVDIRTGDELQLLGESFNALGDCLIKHEAAARSQELLMAELVAAARMASRSLDTRQCGRAIARAVCVHLGAGDAAVYRTDNIEGGVRPAGRCGKKASHVWKRLAARAVDSEEYFVVAEHSLGQSRPSENSTFLVSIPLHGSSGALGAIVARFQGHLTREDLMFGSLRADVLTAFGIHAAAALGNAEVHAKTAKYSEVLEGWVDHLSGVMEVTDAISPGLNLDQTLSALAEAAASVFHVEKCAILLPDNNGNLEIRGATAGLAGGEWKVCPGQGVIGRAYAERECVTAADLSESPDDADKEAAAQLGIRAALCVPLIVEDKAIGAIAIAAVGGRTFTPKEIRLLTSIGLHAAVIVRNADLYTKESSVAQALQAGLVPQAPRQCRGLGFASKYIPALDEARVGGDFYDVVPLPNGKVGIIMADVSGKGLKAAIHLATCKYMLKALMYEHPDEPAVVLRYLNSAINYFFDLSFFVTVFYAVVDSENGTIDYANAGHPPAFLITCDGRMHNRLGSTGIPVGADFECDYESKQVLVERGDVVLLYTDGVTDAVFDGEPLGIEGLHKMIFRSRRQPISQLVENICAELTSEAGAQQKDDTTLLAVSFDCVGQTTHEQNGGKPGHGSHLAVGAA